MLDRRGWPEEVNSLLDISGLSQIFKLAIRLHLLHLGGGRTYESTVMPDRRGWLARGSEFIAGYFWT